jgi:CheY-like chemotaxis protein/HPt (histidine-containing phosphotransfer) domain-containing protein
MKPVKQSDVLDAVLRALGLKVLNSAEPAARPASILSARPLRILLAEDNILNQKLAIRILETWGHSLVVAGNGKEALAAVEAGVFDLVLMDVQMPEMDGLAATAAIRRREGAGGKRLPIIGLTAHAMKRHRDICLGAGMDDYITKPIQKEELRLAMEKAMAWNAEAPSADPSNHIIQGLLSFADEAGANSATSEITGGFDEVMALARVGGDKALLKFQIDLFLGNEAWYRAKIRDAIAGMDRELIEREAHTLKGHVAAFSESARVAAFQLEVMASEGPPDRIEAALAVVEGEIERLRPILEAWSRTNTDR